MSLGSFLFGSDSSMESFNPQSLKALLGLLEGGGLQGNELYGGGSNFLKSLFSSSPNAFASFEAPYMQQFQQQIAPGIAERFAGMGTGGGALRSSGLYNSLAQAGSGLQNQLASLRGNLQMQALPQTLGYAQQPIQNKLAAAQAIPQQYYEIPGQEGLVQGAVRAFAQGAGKAAAGGF